MHENQCETTQNAKWSGARSLSASLDDLLGRSGWQPSGWMRDSSLSPKVSHVQACTCGAFTTCYSRSPTCERTPGGPRGPSRQTCQELQLLQIHSAQLTQSWLMIGRQSQPGDSRGVSARCTSVGCQRFNCNNHLSPNSREAPQYNR